MCPACHHPWTEHRAIDGDHAEHECQADVGGSADGWGATPCDCQQIPPGHSPDWVTCTTCLIQEKQ